MRKGAMRTGTRWIAVIALLGLFATPALAQQPGPLRPVKLKVGLTRCVLHELILRNETRLEIDGKLDGTSVRGARSRLKYQVTIKALKDGVVTQIELRYLEHSRLMVNPEKGNQLSKGVLVGQSFQITRKGDQVTIKDDRGRDPEPEFIAIIKRHARFGFELPSFTPLDQGPPPKTPVKLDQKRTRALLHGDASLAAAELHLTFKDHRSTGGRLLALFKARLQARFESTPITLQGTYFQALDDASLNGLIVQGLLPVAKPKIEKKDGKTLKLSAESTLRLKVIHSTG